MKKAFLTIAVLVSVLGMAPTIFAQRPLTIRLGVHGAVQGAPDVIAIRQGYFKQEHLEVDWRRFGVGREGRDAMIAGAIDINATATTPFLIGLEKGVPYSAVAVNSYFCGTNHIVVRKESDIQSIAQLKGKRIALARGTVTEYIFAAKIAPAYGLKPGDYDPMPVFMAATPEFVEKNPQAVVEYLRAWLDVGRDFKQNPAKAADVIYTFFTSKGYTMSRQTFSKAMTNVEVDIGFPADIRPYLQQIAEGLLKENKIGAIPDWNKALRPQFMEKARS